MTMLWTVKDVIELLEREYKPEQQIVFALMTDSEVSTRTGLEPGPFLEAVMHHFQMVVAGNDHVFLSFMGAGVDEVRMNQESEICVLCHREGDWTAMKSYMRGHFRFLAFCDECQELPGVFASTTAADVLSGTEKFLPTRDFMNYLDLPWQTITWAEYSRPAVKVVSRTLVRVERVDEEQDTLTVIVPGWVHDIEVTTRLSAVPAAIRQLMGPKSHHHTQVNTSVEQPEDLIFVNWEAR